MGITYKCFECEGEKLYFITFEHGGPNYEPCNICKGKGVLNYDDEQIKYFFSDYKLEDYMGEMSNIRKRFIKTDGSEWGPNDLSKYVETMESNMKNKILAHMITNEWMKFVDSRDSAIESNELPSEAAAVKREV